MKIAASSLIIDYRRNEASKLVFFLLVYILLFIFPSLCLFIYLFAGR